MTTLNPRWKAEVDSHYAQVLEKAPKNYTHFATMLYGSQNYGLATADSDVDTKTMMVPDVKTVVLGRKMLSTEYVMQDGSLDNCKDYRAMFQNYLKGNINFVETLYSAYDRVNPLFLDAWRTLQAHRDLVANTNPNKLMHMAAGMAMQKFKAMEHPFESKLPVLAKYGYDPKQLHHLVRLRLFMEAYFEFRSFEPCLAPPANKVDYLMDLKVSPLPLENARGLAKLTMSKVDDLVKRADDELPTDNHTAEAVEFLDALTEDMFMTMLRASRQPD